MDRRMNREKITPFLIGALVILVVAGGYFLVRRVLYAHDIIQAQKYEEKREYLEAIKIYRKVLSLNPENIELYKWLGNVYLRIGEEEKAKEIFVRGLAVQPDNYFFLVKAGLISFRQNDFSPAERYFARALSKKPREGALHFYLARTYHEEAKGKLAEDEYKRALECGFNLQRTYTNLAYLYEFTLRDYEQALEYYEKLVSSGSKDEAVLKRIQNLKVWIEGQRLEDAGEFEKAIIAYEHALEKEPGSIELYTRLGRVYRKCNKFPEAERTYLKALYMKKDDYYILNNLGSLYMSLNRIEDARACWLSAIKVQPTLPNAHFNMAVLLEKENKRAESLKEYRLALKYGYDPISVYLSLGNLYEQNPDDRKRAIECYRKYIESGGPQKDMMEEKIKSLSTDIRKATVDVSKDAVDAKKDTIQKKN